jgi:hypothetical protein
MGKQKPHYELSLIRFDFCLTGRIPDGRTGKRLNGRRWQWQWEWEWKARQARAGTDCFLARTSQKSCLIDELMRQQPRPPRVTLIRQCLQSGRGGEARTLSRRRSHCDSSGSVERWDECKRVRETPL